MNSQTPMPLEGVKVLDCTQVMAGPFCSLLLADMGADVIKVERPDGGDETRKGPPYINGWSAAFLAVNRNKRGLALDLRNPEGQKVFKELVKTADVMVENFRPRTLERLGLGYQQLKEIRPELIYCSISGFGQTGPYSSRGGYDLIAQGMSGIMSVTGIPDGPPVKVGVPMTDLTAGMYSAYGILNSYIYRLRTGQGQMVDMSLMEAGIAYTVWESTVYFATGEVPGPLGSAHRLSAPYQAFRTGNGYITVGGAAQALWEKMCNAIGRPELPQDPRFANRGDRKARDVELAALLEETFSTQTTEHWMEILEAVGVPAGPINNLDQVYNDPHVQARNMEVDLDDPELGILRNIGIPVKLSETPGRIRHRAPALGEHTREVLEGAGYSSQDVDKLIESGVVKVHEPASIAASAQPNKFS